MNVVKVVKASECIQSKIKMLTCSKTYTWKVIPNHDLNQFVSVNYMSYFLFMKLSDVVVKFPFNAAHERSSMEWSVWL